jgi:hypothetical protein
MHIIILDKKESVKCINVKDFQLDTLYKKAGFKSANGFQKQREFKLSSQTQVLEIYGKITGHTDTENLDDIFQIPQLDERGNPKPAIYGNAVVLLRNLKPPNEYQSLTLKDWEEKKKIILQQSSDADADADMEVDAEEDTDTDSGELEKEDLEKIEESSQTDSDSVDMDEDDDDGQIADFEEDSEEEREESEKEIDRTRTIILAKELEKKTEKLLNISEELKYEPYI